MSDPLSPNAMDPSMQMAMLPVSSPVPPSPPRVVPACLETAAAAEEVLKEHCGGCHSDPVDAKGGFSTVLDVSSLVASGKVAEYQPDMSLILQRMVNGSMPPATVQERPDAGDIDALESWIDCGAPDWSLAAGQPLMFATIDWRLGTILGDLRATANPSQRERYRYFDFSALFNAGYTEDELEVYRQAVSFLLNSLSRGISVTPPEPIDADRLLYRIDLQDYIWDEDTWAQLEDEYPYAVIYDEDSRLYPFDENAAEQIREETNTQIPFIQADWFLSHASRPPLYFTLLELPDSLQGLERQLGIDVNQNIADEDVVRSGFQDSEPSQNNRIIERHDLGGSRGAFWQSYDFASNADFGNIFAHPLDFQEAGGEMIFNLDNGLQAYFVADAAGNRLDKAPNAVVQDPRSRDGAVETGISCMNCHMTDGILQKFDEVRDFQLGAGANAQEIEAVLAIYGTREVLLDVFERDQNRYGAARDALGLTVLTNTTMHELDGIHLGFLDLDVVASVVGIPPDDLKRSIDSTPQAFPPEILTLRRSGGGIQRDAFDEIFDDLVEAIGLGDQLLTSPAPTPFQGDFTTSTQ